MSSQANQHQYTNELIHESSPYLLQHAHNPVNWYPWSEEALAKAKKENKLIIISVGYAACHWCHVMEHESFEDEEVAQAMNEHFISIKVDREERPDIDQVYMNAVQLLTGRGGWPLNCIALPDGRPIYGGTYFQKSQWLNVLSQVVSFVKNNPEKTETQATNLTKGVKSSDIVELNETSFEYSLDDLKRIVANWKQQLDFEEGGHLGAPKFPLPIGFHYLLNHYYLTQDKDVFKSLNITLEKMAFGGIYDQIGGGFSRYSVDDVWKVPHFEKMLYDNAQLISLYSLAYQHSKNPNYQTIIEETLEFIQRELTSEKGGFYSSLDADSEGVEGKFYVWKNEEIQAILGKNADTIIDYYNLTDRGNWEHGNNILFKSGNEVYITKKYTLSETELDHKVTQSKALLLAKRGERIRPSLDDKILTSWNGLMLKGYVDAYRALSNETYLSTAIANAEFIQSNLKKSDWRLHRNFKNGRSSINAFLDDYAFVISGFIALYQSTFDEKWLLDAKKFLAYTLSHFYDENSGMFFYTSDNDPALIARKMEVSDNVIPAANSEMAKNLFVIGQYFYENDYISKAKQMLNNVKKNTLTGGAYYANWDILMSWFVQEPFLVAIVGNNCLEVKKEIEQMYLPNVFLSGSKTDSSLPSLNGKFIDGQTTLYVCKNNTCQKPVTTISEALKQIKSTY